jgi:hypothetical protein
VIIPTQRPLPDNTKHSQHTYITLPHRTGTHNPSKRVAADRRLRTRGHWEVAHVNTSNYLYKCQKRIPNSHIRFPTTDTPPPPTHNSCKQRAMGLRFLELILTPDICALVLIQSSRRLKFLGKQTGVTDTCRIQRYTVLMTADFYWHKTWVTKRHKDPTQTRYHQRQGGNSYLSVQCVTNGNTAEKLTVK